MLRVAALAMLAFLTASCGGGPRVVLEPGSQEPATTPRTFALDDFGGGKCNFDYSAQLLVAEVASGTILRVTDVPWTWQEQLHTDGSHLLATARVRNGPFALDLDGDPLWQIDNLGDRADLTPHGLVVTDHNESAALVDNETGSIVWRDTEHDRAFITPDSIFLSSSDGTMRRVDLAATDDVWQADFGNRLAQQVLIGTDLGFIDKWDRLIAIDPATGERVWSRDPGPGRAVHQLLGADGDAVAIIEGPGVGGDAAGREEIVVLDRTDGGPLWSKRNGEHRPAAVVGQMLLARDRGRTVAYELGTGAELWGWQGVAEGLREAVLVGGQVILPFREWPRTRLLLVDAATGDLSWTVTVDGVMHSPPAATDDLVLVGLSVWNRTADLTESPGLLVALDRNSGATVWAAETRDPVLASPVVVADRLYALTADNSIFCD